MSRLFHVKLLLLALVALFSITSEVHAYSEFDFINSNNGARMQSNSNKLDCLRAVMMSVNHGISNAFDCSADKCYQHGTSFVKGRIYSCFDDGGTIGGHPTRTCKIDGPYSTWRTLHYSQGIEQCIVCPQASYTGGSCSTTPWGDPLMRAMWEFGGSQNQVVRIF